MKRKEPLTQATAWMKPTCFKMSEESQTQKTVLGKEEERLEGVAENSSVRRVQGKRGREAGRGWPRIIVLEGPFALHRKQLCLRYSLSRKEVNLCLAFQAQFLFI